MSKPIATVYVYASSSGSGEYQTLKYDDGSLSCDCMGWTRRTDTNGNRSCKHTRDVNAGARNCERWYDAYAIQHTATPPTPPPTRNKTRAPKQEPERIFQLED